MICALKGEFEARIGGEARRFDTRLASIAAIEERCGDVSIVEIVNRVVFGRRARDQRALIAAALTTIGHEAVAAEALAGQASLAEAEAFILALMAALGFEIAPRREGGEPPLPGGSGGSNGEASPSAR